MNEPLILVSAPPPSGHTSTSWMKMSLQGKSITLSENVGNQPIVLILQDPSFLVQIVKEGVDQAVEGLGTQVWQQTFLASQQMGNLNISTMDELSSLMKQTFQSLPFFPNAPYPTSSQTPMFVPWTPPSNTPLETYQKSENQGEESQSLLEALK